MELGARGCPLCHVSRWLCGQPNRKGHLRSESQASEHSSSEGRATVTVPRNLTGAPRSFREVSRSYTPVLDPSPAPARLLLQVGLQGWASPRQVPREDALLGIWPSLVSNAREARREPRPTSVLSSSGVFNFQQAFELRGWVWSPTSGPRGAEGEAQTP